MMGVSSPIILAVDIGSSSVKASLIDVRGNVLHRSKIPLPVSRSGLYSEMEIEDLWEAFASAVRALIEPGSDSGRIRAVGVTAQMSGLILMDSACRALRNPILGIDRRGNDYVPELNEAANGEDIEAITGCPPLGIYPAPKIRWIAGHEPELLERAAYIGGIKEYILWRLTGKWVTDPASASTTQMYDQRKKMWWLAFAESLGVRSPALPVILNPDEQAGLLLGEAAQALKIDAGIPVAVGTGDGPAANLSTGSITGDKLCLSLGTTAVARFIVEESVMPERERNYFQQHFGWNLYMRGLRMEDVGSRIQKLLTSTDLRSDSNPLLQDVLEQILFALYKNMRPVMNRYPLSEIRPIGGGAENEQWLQDISDLFQLPMAITSSTDSTLGAALLAMKSVGYCDSLQEACERMVRIEKRLQPNAAGSEAILKKYRQYEAGLKGGDKHHEE